MIPNPIFHSKEILQLKWCLLWITFDKGSRIFVLYHWQNRNRDRKVFLLHLLSFPEKKRIFFSFPFQQGDVVISLRVLRFFIFWYSYEIGYFRQVKEKEGWTIREREMKDLDFFWGTDLKLPWGLPASAWA